MNLKKKISLSMAGILLAATLTACGGGGAENNPDSPGGSPSGAGANSNANEVIVAIASSPETIDPALNSASDVSTYTNHSFENIMRYMWDGTGIEYGQAESHTVSEDGMTWTFVIRENAKWSDGKAVTAEDFVYSWQRFVDPATGAPYAYDMGMYFKNGVAITDGEMPPEELGVRAIDERTLEVQLENPCPYFLEIMAFPALFPVRRDMIEEHGDRWTRSGDTYISNGAFKMESFTLDGSMVMVQNEHYWDAENVTAEKITWMFLSDNVARLAALRSGAVSYILDFPAEERNAVESAGMYRKSPLLGTYYVCYNTELEPFNDPLVRKALTLAIDNAFIADVLRQGSVVPATAFVGDSFFTSGHDVEFRKEGANYIDPYNYEEAKAEAQKALAEAGYPNGEGFPRVEYLLNDDSTHSMIAEAIQQMWKEVLNVNMEIRSAEWSVVLSDRRAGNFQVSRNGWIADFNDPVTMLGMFMSTSANNDGNYSNPEFDRLIEESMRETDPAKRSALLHQAEAVMLGQDWACAPIYYYCVEAAASPNLKNFYSSMLGYEFFHRAYLE
ncbi:MAG: peptide ABC transporter substrate-binding protein [Oscillospiraceae bacterium]|nr:peptide ABC transporter substrate-binding protein [Oscillospiraceae bacterium]